MRGVGDILSKYKYLHKVDRKMLLILNYILRNILIFGVI